MTRRLSALAAFLELDGDELRAIAQWAALVFIGACGLVFAAVIFGLVVRVFACTGGITC